jgi:hypothetical protein
MLRRRWPSWTGVDLPDGGDEDWTFDAADGRIMNASLERGRS